MTNVIVTIRYNHDHYYHRHRAWIKRHERYSKLQGNFDMGNDIDE